MEYRVSHLLWALILFAALFIPLIGNADDGDNNRSYEEESSIEVDMERIHARIDPEIELTLPSGRFHLRFDEDFRKSHTTFGLNYEFLANAINGSIQFSRPIGRLTPGIRFYDGFDFENTFSPAIRNDDIILLPRKEYVQRDRGMELNALLPLYIPKGENARSPDHGLFLKGAFILNDTFRGDLDRAEVIDEGLDLILLSNLFYRSVRQKQSPLGTIPLGTFASSLLEMRYRNEFHEPVALDHRNKFVYYNEFFKRISFTGNASLCYPIMVWRDEIATFYKLGGYDTIRGYSKYSIGAFRYLLLSTDFGFLIKSTKVDIPEILTLDFKLTQVRLLFLVDGLLSQSSLNVDSTVFGRVSVGSGVSLVFVEGKKRHYTLNIYAAQALERGLMPMFYFSIISSRFNYRESVEI